MSATSLELAVLAWIIETTTVPGLVEQLRAVDVAEREFSGAGSFTTLTLPPEIKPLPEAARLEGADGPVQGPDVESQHLLTPATTLLWFTDRRLSLLEIAGSGIVSSHPERFRLADPRQ